MKNQYKGGLPKKWAWAIYRFKGSLPEEGGFEGGVGV